MFDRIESIENRLLESNFNILHNLCLSFFVTRMPIGFEPISREILPGAMTETFQSLLSFLKDTACPKTLSSRALLLAKSNRFANLDFMRLACVGVVSCLLWLQMSAAQETEKETKQQPPAEASPEPAAEVMAQADLVFKQAVKLAAEGNSEASIAKCQQVKLLLTALSKKYPKYEPDLVMHKQLTATKLMNIDEQQPIAFENPVGQALTHSIITTPETVSNMPILIDQNFERFSGIIIPFPNEYRSQMPIQRSKISGPNVIVQP